MTTKPCTPSGGGYRQLGGRGVCARGGEHEWKNDGEISRGKKNNCQGDCDRRSGCTAYQILSGKCYLFTGSVPPDGAVGSGSCFLRLPIVTCPTSSTTTAPTAPAPSASSAPKSDGAAKVDGKPTGAGPLAQTTPAAGSAASDTMVDNNGTSDSTSHGTDDADDDPAATNDSTSNAAVVGVVVGVCGCAALLIVAGVVGKKRGWKCFGQLPRTADQAPPAATTTANPAFIGLDGEVGAAVPTPPPSTVEYVAPDAGQPAKYDAVKKNASDAEYAAVAGPRRTLVELRTRSQIHCSPGNTSG